MQTAAQPVLITGDVTLDTATAVLARGREALAAAGHVVFDLGQVGGLDSAALSVVFAWVREAGAAGKQVSLINAPQELLNLANVYGVSEMLPLA